MKITMLGTGHATVTKCYNTCFTISENGKHFLVDAGGGNGILKQLEDANINTSDITSMFISHTHTDHIMGAVWIIRVIGRKYLVEDYETPFNIYGNNEVIDAIRKMCEAVGRNVVALHRSKIGNIGVKDIELGKWRYLKDFEVKTLIGK